MHPHQDLQISAMPSSLNEYYIYIYTLVIWKIPFQQQAVNPQEVWGILAPILLVIVVEKRPKLQL